LGVGVVKVVIAHSGGQELKSLALLVVNVWTYHRCVRSPITCKFYSLQYHFGE